MSLYDYFQPPESGISPEEWDYAYFQVCSELIREGMTRAEAERHADDLTVADQAEYNRHELGANRAAERADRRRKDRLEGWL